MMAGSHIIVGAAAWNWAAPHLALDQLAIALVIAGALLPDIDHPASWVGQRLRVISRPRAAMIEHLGVTYSIVAALTLGETVRAWTEYLPLGYLPLAHPSPRNQPWLAKKQWFEEELVRELRSVVQTLML